MPKSYDNLDKELMAAFAAGAKNKEAGIVVGNMGRASAKVRAARAKRLLASGANSSVIAPKIKDLKQPKIKAKDIDKYGTVDEKRIATKTGDKMTKFFDKHFGSGGKKRAKAVKAVREAGDDQAKLIEANKELAKLDRNRTWKRVGAGVGAAGLLGGAGVGGGLIGHSIGNG
jgi:hypothetical protein